MIARIAAILLLLAPCCAAQVYGVSGFTFYSDGLDARERLLYERLIAGIENIVTPVAMPLGLAGQAVTLELADLPPGVLARVDTPQLHVIGFDGRLIPWDSVIQISSDWSPVLTDHQWLTVVMHEIGHVLGWSEAAWGGDYGAQPLASGNYYVGEAGAQVAWEDYGLPAGIPIEGSHSFFDPLQFMFPNYVDGKHIDRLFWTVIEETRGAPIEWGRVRLGRIEDVIPRRLRNRAIVAHG